MLPVYFDTEFTGLHQSAKLISIGCVSCRNDIFYAEFSDYGDGFISESDRQFFKKSLEPKLRLKHEHNRTVDVSGEAKHMLSWELYGDTTTIAQSISNWLRFVGRGKSVQMWSDCLAYDWVLFCNMWGHALNLPGHISYIPMDLSTLLWLKNVNPDISREVYAGLNSEELEQKHGALHDARVIKLCAEKASKKLNNYG